MRLATNFLCLSLALMLGACVAPSKIQKAQQDRARFDQEQSERASYDRCNQDSVPGTPQHLACRLSAEKQK